MIRQPCTVFSRRRTRMQRHGCSPWESCSNSCTRRSCRHLPKSRCAYLLRHPPTHASSLAVCEAGQLGCHDINASSVGVPAGRIRGVGLLNTRPGGQAEFRHCETEGLWTKGDCAGPECNRSLCLCTWPGMPQENWSPTDAAKRLAQLLRDVAMWRTMPVQSTEMCAGKDLQVSTKGCLHP